MVVGVFLCHIAQNDEAFEYVVIIVQLHWHYDTHANSGNSEITLQIFGNIGLYQTIKEKKTRAYNLGSAAWHQEPLCMHEH